MSEGGASSQPARPLLKHGRLAARQRASLPMASDPLKTSALELSPSS